MGKKITAEDLRGRIAVSPAEAALLLGLSRRGFYDLVMPAVRAGRIKGLKIGRCQRIIVASLQAWAEAEAARNAA